MNTISMPLVNINIPTATDQEEAEGIIAGEQSELIPSEQPVIDPPRHIPLNRDVGQRLDLDLEPGGRGRIPRIPSWGPARIYADTGVGNGVKDASPWNGPE